MDGFRGGTDREWISAWALLQRPRSRHGAIVWAPALEGETGERRSRAREETNSIAIASNQAFSAGWTNTFTDPRLCAAIIDRLTVAGLIIETGTDSYRLAHAKAQLAAHQ